MIRGPAPSIERAGAILRWAVACAAGLLLAPAALPDDETDRWHVYAGAIAFNWSTEGDPGHTVDCRTRECDRNDFDRSNLDSSMGFRIGAERPLAARGRLRVRAGAEGSVRFTDYDLSQRELRLVDLAGVLGTGVDLGPVHPWLRVGLGATLTDDGRARGAMFVEPTLDIRLRDGAALRIAGRWTDRNGPDDNDTSFVLVSSGNVGDPGSRWSVETSAGVAIPGGLVGRHLELKRGPFWQMSAFRELGAGRNRAGLALDLIRAESTERTVFRTIPGNERTEEMLGIAAVWDRRIGAGDLRRLRAGAGVKVADWEDEFSLLIDRSGRPVLADRNEIGVVAKLEATFRPAARYPVLFGVEQVYWPDIELGELRLRVGVEIAI